MQRRPHALLDTVSMIFGAKTDVELADRLLSSGGTISRIRKGTQPISSDLILRIHLRTKLTVENIMELVKEEKARRQRTTVHRVSTYGEDDDKDDNE